MRQKSTMPAWPSERLVKTIRRATRKQYSAEEKIRIVLDGLRGESSIAELCRREGIAEGTLLQSWSKEFLEAGNAAGWQATRRDRCGTSSEVTDLRREARTRFEGEAEQALELRLLKKSMIAGRETGQYEDTSAPRGRRSFASGRAIAPAGSADAGHARHPADDVLPVVCAPADGRARGAGRQAVLAPAGVEQDSGGGPRTDRRTGAGRAGAVAAGRGDALHRYEEITTCPEASVYRLASRLTT